MEECEKEHDHSQYDNNYVAHHGKISHKPVYLVQVRCQDLNRFESASTSGLNRQSTTASA